METEFQSIDEKPKVGGWLLFFCIVLTFIGPLVILFTLANSIQAFSKLSVYSSHYHATFIALFAEIGLLGLLIYLSVSAGLALWKISPKAIYKTKVYLFVYLGYSLAGFILPIFFGQSSYSSFISNSQLMDSLKDLVRSLIYFFVWFAYITSSKRVKATFGLNKLLDSTEQDIQLEPNDEFDSNNSFKPVNTENDNKTE